MSRRRVFFFGFAALLVVLTLARRGEPTSPSPPVETSTTTHNAPKVAWRPEVTSPSTSDSNGPLATHGEHPSRDDILAALAEIQPLLDRCAEATEDPAGDFWSFVFRAKVTVESETGRVVGARESTLDLLEQRGDGPIRLGYVVLDETFQACVMAALMQMQFQPLDGPSGLRTLSVSVPFVFEEHPENREPRIERSYPEISDAITEAVPELGRCAGIASASTRERGHFKVMVKFTVDDATGEVLDEEITDARIDGKIDAYPSGADIAFEDCILDTISHLWFDPSAANAGIHIIRYPVHFRF